MIQKFRDTSPMPPRLSMDEYVDFMSQNMEHRVLDQTLIQKDIEERILKPFSLHSDDIAAAP